jgi:probable HAF family extracellular repeat protein
MLLSFGLTALVLLGVRGAVAQSAYTVKDLGTLGGTFSYAGGINHRGDVEGFSNLAGDEHIHAFLWQDGVMKDVGTLGGPNSYAAWQPSTPGEVGGFSDTGIADPLGEDFCFFGTHQICGVFSWRNGAITALPTLGGTNGLGQGVNASGQVTGTAENGTPDPTCIAPQVFEYKPVVWDNGAIQELPTYPGDSSGIADAINQKGQIVGQSGDCRVIYQFFVPSHALLWENGTATPLGSLGGNMSNLAVAINNQGQVVGCSGLSGDVTFHAFLWENGVMQDLGTLPGDTSSIAAGINSVGQVAGISNDADGNSRAFIWQKGLMTDLNTLIPADSPLFLLGATGAINDRGQIAGYAFVKSTGELHAFLATPTNNANRGGAKQSVKVTVPEKARRQLQRFTGRHRVKL